MNAKQEIALRDICARFHVEFDASDYRPTFDLPSDWVAGWVGGYAIQATHPTIYVGVSPVGEISS